MSQFSTNLSSVGGKKKKIICDFGFSVSVVIEDTGHKSAVARLIFLATKAQSALFDAALCIFHQAEPPPRTHGRGQPFQTGVSSDGAPVSALAEGLELLQPGHERGIIVLPGHHGSRLLVPHNT